MRRILLIAAAFAGLAACDAGPRRNFDSADGRFSVEIPPSWNQAGGAKVALALVAPEQEMKLSLKLTVASAERKTKAAIEEEFEAEAARLEKDPGFRGVKPHPLRFGNFKGLTYSTTYTWELPVKKKGETPEKVLFKRTYVHFMTPDGAYDIEFAGPLSLYEKHRTSYSRLLNTIRWHRPR